MNLRLTGLFSLLALLAATATAAPSCDVDPGKKKLYRLELTVPATFCMGSGGRKDPSCKSFPKPALQLHGLWPNYQQGYPSGECGGDECRTQSDSAGKYCAYPKPEGLYGSPAWQRSKDYMAGTEKCLERHEWVKHGTCSPMTPPAYFEWALTATRGFSDALAGLVDQPIERAAFDALVRKQFPAVDGAVHLSCQGQYVKSMYIAYEWGKQPGAPIKTKGGKNSFGNCRNSFVFPSRP